MQNIFEGVEKGSGLLPGAKEAGTVLEKYNAVDILRLLKQSDFVKSK